MSSAEFIIAFLSNILKKKNVAQFVFLEHCPVNYFCFSQGEDRFLLTFIDFFTHVRA